MCNKKSISLKRYFNQEKPQLLSICLSLSTLTKHRLPRVPTVQLQTNFQFEPAQQTEVCLFSVIVTHYSSNPELPSEAYVFV